ncbi:MAG: hypothetical protein JWO82_394 [Akkermansiaceae bacterium]|nr:hypothetical protein [Akkermansiaceae bacterium]
MTGIEKLRSFAKSPHHAWLALLTLGAGLAMLAPIPAIAGVALYALGWIYLPDSKIFNNWLARRSGAADGQKLQQFIRQRAQIYDDLRSAAKTRYDTLAASILSLQKEFQADQRLSGELLRQRTERLSNLAWTYLRLLHTGEMLDRFIESEAPAELQNQIASVERELAALDPSRTTLAESLQARLASMKTRLEKRQGAEASRDLTVSEQERIAELVKLFRADHLASRDAGALSHEIDGAASQLDRTHDWLRDFEFDNSPSDVPATLTAAAPLSVTGGPRRG